VTLLAKAYNTSQRKLVDNFLKFTLKGLKVKTENCEVTPRGWVRIVLSGEDEQVALNYLVEEVGLCPSRLEDVEKNATLKGRLTSMSKSKDELSVDIGVSAPMIIDATISLQRLQAQLVDGRKVALKKIVELFGLRENLPLEVKVLGVSEENGHVEAMLSEKQVKQFKTWTQSLLDRLIIIGSTDYEVKSALKKAGLDRDVVDIKPLGFFEHAVVCKLGTDAKGLIPKIGKNLRNAGFAIFSPKRIIEFLDYSFLDD